MEAAASGSRTPIVFELDTPGGAVPTVLKICESVRASPVQNAVAWVNPAGYAAAEPVIALACREIVVSGQRGVRRRDADRDEPDGHVERGWPRRRRTRSCSRRCCRR
jgi:hypothetical protein